MGFLSMKFSRLIDKENILLDGKKLAEFKDENSLNNKVDDIIFNFLCKNYDDLNLDNVNWILEFAKEIKDKL